MQSMWIYNQDRDRLSLRNNDQSTTTSHQRMDDDLYMSRSERDWLTEQ